MIRFASILILLLAVAAHGQTTQPVRWSDVVFPADTNGYTIFPVDLAARIVHIAPAPDGSDAGDGSTAHPVLTYNRARQLVRPGQPDRIALESGGTYPAFNFVALSGASATRLAVLESYGIGPRPRVPTGLSVSSHFGVITHIDLYDPYKTLGDPLFDPHRDEKTGSTSVGISGGENWLWVEDCRFKCFGNGLSFQGGANIRIRRCTIADNYTTGFGHSEGIYAINVDGLEILDCLFRHCGWSEHPAIVNSAPVTYTPTGTTRPVTLTGHAGRNIFNHAMYLNFGSKNVRVQGNFVTDASLFGCELRAGGLLKNNVWSNNVCGAFVATTDSEIDGDVYLGGSPLNGAAHIEAQAIQTPNVNVHDCIFGPNAFGAAGLTLAPWLAGHSVQPIALTIARNKWDRCGGTSIDANNPSYTITDAGGNLAWGCKPGGPLPQSTTRPTWIDPGRTPATYATSLDYASESAMLDAMEQQTVGHHDVRLTSGALRRYIRHGYASVISVGVAMDDGQTDVAAGPGILGAMVRYTGGGTVELPTTRGGTP